MIAAVLACFVAAMVAPSLVRTTRAGAVWLLALVPAGAALFFLSQIPRVMRGDLPMEARAWSADLGLTLAFRLDGLALLFALLITVIGTFVVVYAGSYLARHAYLARFYAIILAFMGSMLGVVLADNLLALFVFWELTSITSYLLIGFDHERASSRAGSLQALLVTAIGGLVLLAGIVLLGQVGGSYELSVLTAEAEPIRAHALYPAIVVAFLVGAFTKSAQFPFHFWLPNAMEAPTPVSAYLHSATMVKAGIYLLARMTPVLGGSDLWANAITAAGAATMVVGAVLAVKQVDLKRILAYTTVSALGVITMLIGIGGEAGMRAGMAYLLGHALYKGALFLVAGSVDHEAGTRDISQLGGLRAAMPMTAAAAGMAALSMAGLPPLFGFIGKEVLYETVIGAPAAALGLAGAAFAASLLFVVAAGLVAVVPFFGPPVPTPKHAHEAPAMMWAGPVTLAGLGLVAGLFPGLVDRTLVAPAAAAAFGREVPPYLALWHGLTPALVLSVVTVAVGAVLFARRRTVASTLAALDPLEARGPESLYQGALAGLMRLAAWQTRILQGGYLRHYLLIVLVTTIVLVGSALLRVEEIVITWRITEMRFYDWALGGLVLGGALAAVKARSRLGAVAALGVVGFGMALIYVVFGAPDLAMTQVLVETMTVVLFVLVFYHLPNFATLSRPGARARDAAIAMAMGTIVTLLVLVALSVPAEPISGYFLENSRPLAHGRNVVNVILVDFRALDTLGEITVLAAAAVGVYGLLKLKLERERSP